MEAKLVTASNQWYEQPFAIKNPSYLEFPNLFVLIKPQISDQARDVAKTLWTFKMKSFAARATGWKPLSIAALQIRTGQRTLTTNLWSLTAHIYHVMIMVTGGFSKKSIFIIFRSSRTQMFFKTGVIGNFAIFTGKHLWWSLFLIKLQALGLQLNFHLVPKETSTQVHTPFFIEHLRWLLLSIWKSNYSVMISICQSFPNQKQKLWGGFY